MPSDATRTVVLADGARSLTLYRYTLTARGQRPVVCGRRTVTIGSAPDNDVVIEDPGVSRRHARLEVDERGYRLDDLGSRNGTWVGDARIASAWIADGAEFVVGETPVRFDLTDEIVEVRLSGRDRFGRLLGQSTAMREVFGLLEKVASTDLTVLVQGESGTGKELVAEAVHKQSDRRNGPFVVFDCSAVARDLIESSLFGHVCGAFTGAVGARRGAFEEANGGTLFIDELGELGLDLQPRLLRALERREVQRVGANDVTPVDVRIVAATNRDLRAEVEAGQFREDLFYRLAVVQVQLPPLRERVEDIPLLVEHFLEQARERSGNAGLNIAWSTMERLQKHPWPGNVRELKHFIDRAVVLASDTGRVETRYLQGAPSPPSDPQTEDGAFVVDTSIPFKQAKTALVDAFECAYWTRVLDDHDGNVSAAARATGVHRKSLEYILKKHDLGRRSG